MNLWMSFMPVSVQLEGPPCLNYRVIVTGSAYELQPDREIFVRESTRNGHCWKPANIADTAERIRKSQIGFQIHGQGCRRNGLGCCSDDVKCIKQGIHFFLDDFPHFEGLQVIGSGVLLVYVAR